MGKEFKKDICMYVYIYIYIYTYKTPETNITL